MSEIDPFAGYRPDLLPHPIRWLIRHLFNLNSDSDTPNTGGAVFLDEQEVTWHYPSQEELFNANISGWGFDHDGTEQ